MRRVLLSLVVALAPCLLALTAGCEPEVKSVEQSREVQESEPQMTSPGQEVLE